MKKAYLICLGLFLSMSFYTCQDAGQGSENDNSSDSDTTEVDSSDTITSEETQAEPPKVDEKFDALGKLLAGIKSESENEYTKYEQNPGWQNYAASADGQWGKLKSGKWVTMKTWRDEYLKGVSDQKGVLFYPFSGADIFHAVTFFPEAEEIVMIGLEPIGNLPDIEAISQKSLAGYFGSIQTTLYEILNLSFFKTIDMAQEFTGRSNVDLDGTLPVLMLFLERTDHKILYYEQVAVNPDGTLSPKSEANITDTTYVGTKITFQRNDQPDEYKTLYYFGANIDNNYYESRSGLRVNGLNKHVDFRTYLENLNIKYTYLKSASYLMYRDHFSIIRNLILDKSDYILQDDSGMPFASFKSDIWDITLYGRYAGPIGLFSSRYQADFAAAYSGGKYPVKPLPFGIGYQYQKGNSNLMLAKKK